MTLHPGVELNREIDREEHLTLATLDCRLKITKDVYHPLAHLVVKINNSEHVLCFLEKGITHQQSLDFIFQKGDKLVFKVEGNAVIHITGYSMRDSIYEDTQHGDNTGIRIVETVSLAGVQGDQKSTLFFEDQLETNDEKCSSLEGGQHEGHSREPSIKLERNEGSDPSHRTTEGTVEWEDNGVATSSLQISAGDFNHVQRANETDIYFSDQNIHENLGVVSRDHANPTEVHTDCGRGEIEHEIAEDNVNGNQIESNLRGKCRPSERQTTYQPSLGEEVPGNSKQDKGYQLLFQDGQSKEIDDPVPRETSEEVKKYSNKFAGSNCHFQNSNAVEECMESSSLHDSSVQETNSFENEEEDIIDLEPKEQSVDLTCNTCLDTAEHEIDQELAVSEEDDNGTDEFNNVCQSFVGSTQKSVVNGSSLGESPDLSLRCNTGKKQCSFTLKDYIDVDSKKGSLKSPEVNPAKHRRQNKRTESKAAEGNKGGSNKSSTTMENQFLCQFCGILFTQIQHFQAHERNHGNNESFECQFCGKLFSQKSQIMLHEREHQIVKEPCKSHSSKAITMKKQGLKHEKRYSIEKPFQCHTCSKRCNSKAHLIQHAAIHKSVRPFQCQYCLKRFKTKVHVVQHEKIHTGVRPFKCQFCGKTFIAKNHVVQHERIHTGERPFKCKFCSKAFVQKSHCTQHEKLHTGEKPHKCQFCETRYISKSHLRNHEKRCQSGKSLFSCQFCSNTFTTKSQLTQHEKSHRPTDQKHFKCLHCDQSFLHNTDKTLHEKNHITELPFKCQLCVKRFITKEKLTQHEKSHRAEKKFKCSYCKQFFRSKAERAIHERIHTNDRPYQCSFCSKRFIQKNHVDSHERLHTNERPFKCSICGRGFPQKSSLNYHEGTHKKQKGH